MTKLVKRNKTLTFTIAIHVMLYISAGLAVAGTVH